MNEQSYEGRSSRDDEIGAQHRSIKHNQLSHSKELPKSDLMEDFDDIFQQAALQQGHGDGKQAAEKASFQEGQRLGQVTGVDYGMEIGFAMGLVEAVKEWLSEQDSEHCRTKHVDDFLSDKIAQASEVHRATGAGNTLSLSSAVAIEDASTVQRIRKSVDDLETAICDFPRMQELFYASKQGVGENDNDEAISNSEPSSHKTNVREGLQCIRARSKVLTAKLGMPHHSLKRILQEHGLSLQENGAPKTTASSTAAVNNKTSTSEW